MTNSNWKNCGEPKNACNFTQQDLRTSLSPAAQAADQLQPPAHKTPQRHIARRTPSSSPSAELARHAVETPRSSPPAPNEYRASPSTASSSPAVCPEYESSPSRNTAVAPCEELP